MVGSVSRLLHDSGVDVAKLFEAEQAGAMGGIVEHETLGGIVLAPGFILTAMNGGVLTVEA